MIPTHVVTFNNSISMDLNDAARTIADQLHQGLQQLDGTEDFSFILWKLPDGAALGDKKAKQAIDRAFIQAAGSASAMAVEIKKTIDGVAHQYAIGRPANAPVDGPAVVIPFAEDAHVLVRSNEVFDAEEATRLYVSYYETGDIPTGYELRELDMKIGKSGT